MTKKTKKPVKNCENCSCELSQDELNYGENWCFSCLLPDLNSYK